MISIKVDQISIDLGCHDKTDIHVYNGLHKASTMGFTDPPLARKLIKLHDPLCNLEGSLEQTFNFFQELVVDTVTKEYSLRSPSR